MKKIVSVVVVLVMLLSMSVSVFASGEVTGKKYGESQTIDVIAKSESSTVTDTVYSVDIEWEDMTFTYTETETKTWNPATHTYTTNTSGEWDKTEADVTITNHSNAAVDVAVTYLPVEGEDVVGEITNATKELAEGVEGNYDTADQLVATLKISGTPSDNVTADGVVIGQITVTIGE